MESATVVRWQPVTASPKPGHAGAFNERGHQGLVLLTEAHHASIVIVCRHKVRRMDSLESRGRKLAAIHGMAPPRSGCSLRTGISTLKRPMHVTGENAAQFVTDMRI